MDSAPSRCRAGFSLASVNPPLENQDNLYSFWEEKEERSRPFLNYIGVDLELELPEAFLISSLFIRIHHRSGVFGTFCPGICGSNFITYGVRVDL